MTRRRISEALSAGTPLLLADEPTTDLDAGGVQRLREMLASYHGALVLVSHDRDLLDALCSRVWHLEDGRITDFPGSYADYREELKRRRDFQQFEYDRYRSEQARLKALAQQKAEWVASVKKAPKRMGNSEARLHTHEGAIAVCTFTLGSIPVGSISVAFGANTIGPIAVSSISVTLDAVSFGSFTVSTFTISYVTIGSIALSSVSFGAFANDSVTVRFLTFDAFTVGSVTVGSITFDTFTISSIAFGSLSFGSVTVSAITIGAL